MKVLLIDNYDSFTYNLYQLVGQILEEKGDKFILDVFRNDEISISGIREKGYEKIIISPGPGDPSDKNYFGVCAEVLIDLGKTIPVLGVCLGMQGLGYYYGGKVSRAKKIMHGKTSIITHNGKGLFKGLPQDLEVMRYHSLIVEKDNLPKDLEILAMSQDGEIMGLAHKIYPISGVQFHPESFATEGGKKILENFLGI
ncbi:MAG TPA: aminodeoxychorismate/anthranilate synthase component II [Patescibacteria group bacterium]|nr:aminodeoxychorismate/anthranilate synthase component II [Patescibacteria group bacterium]